MRGLSISAVGGGEPLAHALERVLAHSPAVVEIAVGARPPAEDPYDLLHAAARSCVITAHHTLPLLPRANLYPRTANAVSVASLLARFGITCYSAHPPAHGTEPEGYVDWALRYRDALAENGIAFALETMYTPRTAQDRAHGRWPLASEAEVFQFCEWADTQGWEKPLVLDVAHINIGVEHGEWSWEGATALLHGGYVHTLHVSDNDGRSDSHISLRHGSPTSAWLACADLSRATHVIDEGRRL